MLKLDNNSKMIVSKYLIGKDFTDYVKAFNLYDYYHTTFNYIIIDDAHIEFPWIPNLTIKRIKQHLNKFSNLNEIVLNIINLTNDIEILTITNLKKLLNLMKINKPIKFNFISKNYKPYKEIHINGYDIKNSDIEFFENVFEPNVKQKVYVCFEALDYMNILKFKKYNILIDLYGYSLNTIENVIIKLKQLNIKSYYFTDFYNCQIKVNNINDIKKYYIVINEVILVIKTCYENEIKYINDLKLYSNIFKVRHTNLNYLREYVTCSNKIVNEINDNSFININKNNLKIINMYKYGVKNIYREGAIDYNIIFEKFNISYYISRVIISIWLKYKYVYSKNRRLHEEIKYYIQY